jgi:serine protease Do
MSATVNRAAAAGISVGSELAQVVERLRKSVVHLGGHGPGGGSGVIWRPGLIVTNAHVATDSSALVETWDGREFHAELISRNPRRDLAALRSDALNLDVAELGSASDLRAGDLVIAVGHPWGARGAVTTGIVHAALGRRSRWLEADIGLAPGNSGGPLADVHGCVVGINSMIVNGLGMAVPTSEVERFLKHEEEPRIGVTLRPVVVRFDAAESFGLLVIEIEPNSPAHLAGIVPGDILVSGNAERFDTPDSLQMEIREAQRSGSLSLRLLRGGKIQSCVVQVGKPAVVSAEVGVA